MANKRALIVGINKYPSSPLRGCVNDALMVSEMLTNEYGFKASDKRMLTDESATTANIIERLNWLVTGAKAGDILHFHYSGHGSQTINRSYEDDYEPDNLDEIICPVDLNWRDKIIKDDDLKRIFSKVPKGVHLTIVLDCCHSGSGMDHSNQYQSLEFGEVREYSSESPNRSRLLPMPADIANRGLGMDLKPRQRSVTDRSIDDTGLLISGCQSHQTSADAWIDNKYCGAATYAFVKTLETHKFNISYIELIDEMTKFMGEHKFTQRPELNGSASLFNTKVLDGKQMPEPVTTEPAEGPIVDYVVDEPGEIIETIPATTPETPTETPEKKKKSGIIILVVLLLGAIAFGVSQVA